MKITDKLQSFIAENSAKTPYLVVDLDKVKSNYDLLSHYLPKVRCFYSVKSNASKHVLNALKQFGSAFETASLGEINACVNAGVQASNIHFGNTIKTVESIQKAFEVGVNSYAFDCTDELIKLAEHAPGSNLICRLSTDGVGATWGLCNKFGCSVDKAIELLIKAKQHNMGRIGLSFHVGSQQKSPLAWKKALLDAKTVVDALQREGISLDVINIGGGFPASGYLGDDQQSVDYSFQNYGESISQYIEEIFQGNEQIEFMCEPGRFLLSEAGCVKTKVILAAERSSEEFTGRWLYLDVGKFNGLYEATDIKHPIIHNYEASSETQPTILAGPSCDSDDMLTMKGDHYDLPLAISTGDYVVFACTGAYSNSYTTVGFNGFPPLNEFYI